MPGKRNRYINTQPVYYDGWHMPDKVIQAYRDRHEPSKMHPRLSVMRNSEPLPYMYDLTPLELFAVMEELLPSHPRRRKVDRSVVWAPVMRPLFLLSPIHLRMGDYKKNDGSGDRLAVATIYDRFSKHARLDLIFNRNDKIPQVIAKFQEWDQNSERYYQARTLEYREAAPFIGYVAMTILRQTDEALALGQETHDFLKKT